MFELRAMMVEMKMVVSGPLLYIGAAGLLTAIYTMDEVLIAPVLLLLFVLAALQELFSESAKPFSRGSMVLLAILYGAFLPGHFLLLRTQPQGWLCCSWSCLEPGPPIPVRILSGRWGRHKLCTYHQSQQVGGRGNRRHPACCTENPVCQRAALQIGLLPGWVWGLSSELLQQWDLFESALKRGSRGQDSGRILPGHGGVLDRIDSLLFTVPVVYYLTRWMG